MLHQSASLMNYIVSYKLSMAHKFPSIKAITVLCKSAENFILITSFHSVANEFGKKVNLQTYFFSPFSSAFRLILISDTFLI